MTRRRLSEVLAVATMLQTVVGQACQRVSIAGSIRRLASTVEDIELVCIPREHHSTDPQWDPFANSHPAVNQLDLLCNQLVNQGLFAFRPDTKTYGRLNKLMVHQPSGITVNIFTATVEHWGMALMLSTGPKGWNFEVMQALKRRGMQGHADGSITDAAGREIPCPEEDDVFRVLGWPWKAPSIRNFAVRTSNTAPATNQRGGRQ